MKDTAWSHIHTYTIRLVFLQGKVAMLSAEQKESGEISKSSDALHGHFLV